MQGQSENLSSRSNSILVILPYRYHGSWVFDDPGVGLHREPFVSGVPEIIDELVSSIPGASSGFRLIFSASPFPGFQAIYTKCSGEYGGTWYSTEDGRRGWLCPALFKYFDAAPEKLYARAEPQN